MKLKVTVLGTRGIPNVQAALRPIARISIRKSINRITPISASLPAHRTLTTAVANIKACG